MKTIVKSAYFSEYVNRQLGQVRQGGWPVVKRKLRSVASRIAGSVPVLRALYLLCSFISFLTKTLFSPYSKIKLNNFGNRWSKFAEDQLRFQADERSHRLDSIYPLIDRNLPAASKAYCEFVSQHPDYPEGYFQASNALYLQGRYHEALNEYYATGLSLLEDQARQSGLHLLGTRFLGEEWGIVGHIAWIDLVIKAERLDLLSPEKRIVVMRKSGVKNLCYLNYWSEHINVFYLDDTEYLSLRRGFAEAAFEHLPRIKFRQGFTELYSAYNQTSRAWRDSKRLPVLKIKESDRERGLQVFKRLSIPSDAWFVGLHVREGDRRITRMNANANIETYFKAIKAITDRGGWVIRMGHPGMTPLPEMERVVDYANSDLKSDWMDVFLWSCGLFFIGTASGPHAVPPSFGKPVLYTNCPCIGINPYWENSVMLPKLYYSNTNKRFFSFREMLDSPLGWTVSKVFEGIDCTIVDNSPEDIEAAAIEMLAAAEYPTDQSDQLSALQNKFNSLRNEYGDTSGATISETFVQKYSSLF